VDLILPCFLYLLALPAAISLAAIYSLAVLTSSLAALTWSLAALTWSLAALT
jgi:hypothetical protein